jgi:hypothetical protein
MKVVWFKALAARVLKSSSSRLLTQYDMPQDVSYHENPSFVHMQKGFSVATYNHLHFMHVSALSYFLIGFIHTFTLKMATAVYG